MGVKINREVMKIFGQTSGLNQIAQFGSLAAGSPVFTTSIPTIQALSNYLNGWFDAVIGGNSPAIEDMNALCFLYAYQLAYQMQTGVPEWQVDTEYFIGSMVTSGSHIYVSKTDNNLGNAVTVTAQWNLYGRRVRNVSGTDTILQTDDIVRADPTAGSFVETLPAIAATPLGKQFIIKNVASNGNQVTLDGNGAELIDGAANIVLDSTPVKDSVTVLNNGTSWDII